MVLIAFGQGIEEDFSPPIILKGSSMSSILNKYLLSAETADVPGVVVGFL